LTSRTLVDARGFRAAIDEIRVRDWAYASEEHELGVHALAVPLRNMAGRTVAALNVVTPPQRFSARQMESAFLPLLLDAASELRPLL
jgi:IclR family pca regulon transcriptional regulator